MDQKIMLIILGMMIVTYLPRMLPVVVLSRLKLPHIFIIWLQYVPVAVLAALLAQTIFVTEGAINLSIKNRYLIAALPCFLVAGKTKNLFLTVFVGIVSMVLLGMVI